MIQCQMTAHATAINERSQRSWSCRTYMDGANDRATTSRICRLNRLHSFFLAPWMHNDKPWARFSDIGAVKGGDKGHPDLPCTGGIQGGIP
jgi:hypothetical protein